MTGFDLEAALNGLKALVLTEPGIEDVRIGAPESLGSRVEAWITIGDPGEIGSPTQGVYELDIGLVLWFGYVIETAEAAAEARLADFVTEVTRRLILNRMGTVSSVTRNLNGSVDRMGLPQAAAGVSDYTMMAGAETRTYPLGIRIIQREALGS